MMQLKFVTIIVQKYDQIYLKYFKQNQEIKGKFSLKQTITPHQAKVKVCIISIKPFKKIFVEGEGNITK